MTRSIGAGEGSSSRLASRGVRVLRSLDSAASAERDAARAARKAKSADTSATLNAAALRTMLT